MHVLVHHLQAVIRKNPLEGKNVPSIFQVGDRIRVTE